MTIPDRHPMRLADIDAADETFRISFDRDAGALARSLSTVGLLHPPTIEPREGKAVVVSGFGRIAAARALGWGEVPVALLSPEISFRRCAVLAVADNATQRGLNPVEVARAVRLLDSAMESKPSLIAALRELGLAVPVNRIDAFKALTALPESIQTAIARDRVPVAVAFEMVRMDEPSACRLTDLFSDLRYSLSKQREVLHICRDLARQSGKSIREILDHADLKTVATDPGMDRGLKGQRFREALHRLRYPRLSAVEAAHAARVAALKLPPTMRLAAPPGFEGAGYTLTLRFDSLDALKAQRDILDRLLDAPPLAEILSRAEIRNPEPS